MGHEQFTQICLPFSGKMYALAYNLLRNRDEVRDCVSFSTNDKIVPQFTLLPFIIPQPWLCLRLRQGRVSDGLGSCAGRWFGDFDE